MLMRVRFHFDSINTHGALPKVYHKPAFTFLYLIVNVNKLRASYSFNLYLPIAFTD